MLCAENLANTENKKSLIHPVSGDNDFQYVSVSSSRPSQRQIDEVGYEGLREVAGKEEREVNIFLKFSYKIHTTL